MRSARQDRRHAAKYIGQQRNYASPKASQHRFRGTLVEIVFKNRHLKTARRGRKSEINASKE
jgi:hypothetical protein